MSNSRKKSLAVPDGWADVLVRTLIVLPVSFVALSLKEWLETHELDILACSIDAASVAAGMLLIYAILMVTSGGTRRTEDPLAAPAAR